MYVNLDNRSCYDSEKVSQLQLQCFLANSMFSFFLCTKQIATQLLSYMFLNTTNIL